MPKKKVPTTKSVSPTLIVFGTIAGKQRAGTFGEVDAVLAKKAATESPPTRLIHVGAQALPTAAAASAMKRAASAVGPSYALHG